ncbi:MAG: membrane protein insertase YidC [Fidelibacterota bacterium]|nr:MAG: membrane protein insertase YidC [Candidatus Neomarinimicrobiota bacterium]
MTDSRRAILAFILIAGVLLLTPRYIRWISPKPESTEAPSEETIPRPDTLPAPKTEEVPREAEYEPEPQLAAPLAPIAQLWDEEQTVIETNFYRTAISSRGGGHIQSFELKEYRHGRSTGNVQLIHDVPRDVNLRLSYVNIAGDTIHLVNNFEVLSAPAQDSVLLSEGSLTLSYRHTFASGARVVKTLTFQADSYTIPIEIRWENADRELGISTYEIGWPNGLQPAEKVLREDETYGKVYVYQGGELEKEGSLRKGRLNRKTLKGNTEWVALRNKYFTSAFIANADQPGEYGAFAAVSAPYDEGGVGTENLTRYFMAMGHNAQQTVQMTLYLGPLSYFIIRDLDVDLERTMNFGFSLIRPISKLVLLTLVFFHDFIPNYGVVLILFAIIIRILTNPLTKKSAMSTQKMQLVQPKVKALQEKYKGNPQKLNQEMMALWKAEGVSPFGGCLPILIQMPVLIALFTVFRSTIELRGQPFVLWVTDLSVPDVVFTLPFSIPLYGSGVTILALIMGATMFIQQKISGAGANPQQKPMMYIMTGMFFLIFNQFPSGLNLYYAFSNILAIFQQRNIRKHLTADTAAKPTAAPKSKPAVKPKKKKSR